MQGQLGRQLLYQLFCQYTRPTPRASLSLGLMASPLRSWIALWLFVSTLIVAWDTGYIMLRPRSMPGGNLHWLWAPYSAYVDVDYIYGFPSIRDYDGFPLAQSTFSVGRPAGPVAGLVDC